MATGSPRIHPTAVISAEAELAEDTRVGPHCVIEGRVRVGPGCVLDEGAYLIGPLVLGRDNHVHGHAVLGERAQHLQPYAPLGVQIGDRNTFWDRVTVHQGTRMVTSVGNGNRFFAGSHVGHDCQVGDGCVLAGGALLGGHCLVGDRVRLGRRAAVHQFCRLGRLARLAASAVTTRDVPPFVVQRHYNTVVGVNLDLMRRAGFTAGQVAAVGRLYEVFYRRGLAIPDALAEAERQLGPGDVVGEFTAFVRTPGRGVNMTRPVA